MTDKQKNGNTFTWKQKKSTTTFCSLLLMQLLQFVIDGTVCSLFLQPPLNALFSCARAV